jgi:release factor glutamine methyltransferase
MMHAAETRVPRRAGRDGSPQRITLRDLTSRMSKLLHESGIDSAALDARLLATHSLGLDRLDIYRNPGLPVTPDQEDAVRSLVDQRASGTPTAYLTGTKEFWSLSLSVDKRVLIPRPETELLVEEALAVARTMPRDMPIIDIGTGSGAVSLALAVELPGASIVSTDISADALDVAAVNVSAHGLTDRITIRRGDLFDAVGRDDRFSLIVSNPPYVTDEEMDRLSPEVRSEPDAALRGGRAGLSVIERLVRGAPAHLQDGGGLVIEIGSEQKEAVRRLIDETEGLVFHRMRRDYAGHPRIVTAHHIDS